jgi:hypothetical protein
VESIENVLLAWKQIIRDTPLSQSFFWSEQNAMSATKEVLKALAEEYLHEFVHVTPVNDIHEPFIHKDETGLMRCVLCSTEWMSPTVMKSHVRGNFQ